MAKTSPKKTGGLADIELLPNAWKRFESFVDSSVKTRLAPAAKRKPSRAKSATSKRAKKA